MAEHRLSSNPDVCWFGVFWEKRIAVDINMKKLCMFWVELELGC